MSKEIASSKVGWPFWIPVIIFTIPFTMLFLHLFSDGSSSLRPWWQPLVVLPVGLMPSLLIGLIVQTIWDVSTSAARGKFTIIDAAFCLFLLALCAVFAWVSLKWPNIFSDNFPAHFLWLVLLPLITLYIRKRKKQDDKIA
jgi:hypothetical protein